MPVQSSGSPLYQAERDRVAWRRARFGRRQQGKNLALALSGGGIRSATFALGVMQALAKTRPDGTPVHDPEKGEPTGRLQEENSWLSRFDYLSTVSGGGYLGAFFGSLFVPGRFREKTSPEEAARTAFEVMRKEPPERFSPSRRILRTALPDRGAAGAGRAMPLAWLRESGRYLLPTGAGDTSYTLALLIRNLLSVHLVVGAVVVLVMSLLALIEVLLFLLPAAHAWWVAALPQPAAPDVAGFWSFSCCGGDSWMGWFMAPPSDVVFWPGAAWWLLPLVAGLWLAPAMLAYWLVHRIEGLSGNRLLPRAVIGDLCLAALAVLLLLLELNHVWTAPFEVWRWIAWALLWVGFAARCLMGWHLRQARARLPALCLASDELLRGYRVLVTRNLSRGLAVLVAVLVLALVETLGQSYYLHQSRTDGMLASGALLSGLGAALAAVRYLARFFDEKKPSGWLARLPLNAIAGVAAGMLGLLLLSMWAFAVQWLAWNGAPPPPEPDWGAVFLRLLLLLALSLLLMVAAARYPGFLGLSSLQQFYAARLTRAYLGASNGRRFASEARSSYSSAEPMPGDDPGLGAYYGPDTLAPLHLINCTLNQTIGPAEQLVQRDRKGRVVCLAPAGEGGYRFFVDGKLASLKENKPDSLGDWVAISGAAISTGLGRTTSLGTSLLCGFANIRLGMWLQLPLSEQAVENEARPPWWLTAFPNQTLLLHEWTARFHGLHAPWQYLTDGGHFENLGVYELLRPERDVQLIIACDCGADPDYQFEDLANLVRLARVDYQLEIVVDELEMDDDALRQAFTTPQAMREAELQRRASPGVATKDTRSAILLKVCQAGRDEIVCRIVLIKPRVVAGLPVDLLHYASLNPDFPQQTTIDQFFDDQQWESYRKLGLVAGEQVLAALFASGSLQRWAAQH